MSEYHPIKAKIQQQKKINSRGLSEASDSRDKSVKTLEALNEKAKISQKAENSNNSRNMEQMEKKVSETFIKPMDTSQSPKERHLLSEDGQFDSTLQKHTALQMNENLQYLDDSPLAPDSKFDFLVAVNENNQVQLRVANQIVPSKELQVKEDHDNCRKSVDTQLIDAQPMVDEEEEQEKSTTENRPNEDIEVEVQKDEQPDPKLSGQNSSIKIQVQNDVKKNSQINRWDAGDYVEMPLAREDIARLVTPEQLLPSTERNRDHSPKEFPDERELSHEIESMCLDIKLSNSNSNQAAHVSLYPEFQVRALKQAKKKRMNEENRNMKRFQQMTQQKNDKFLSDMNLRTNQSKRNAQENKHITVKQMDVSVSGDGPSQDIVEPLKSYDLVTDGESPYVPMASKLTHRKNVLSKSVLSNFHVLDSQREIKFEDSLQADDDYNRLQVNRQRPTFRPGKSITRIPSHQKMIPILNEKNENIFEQTASSFTKSRTNKTQFSKFEVRKPSLMRRRVNYFPLHDNKLSQDEYQARHLKTHQRPRLVNISSNRQNFSNLTQTQINIQSKPNYSSAASYIGEQKELFPPRISTDMGSNVDKLSRQRDQKLNKRYMYQSTKGIIKSPKAVKVQKKVQDAARSESPPKTDRGPMITKQGLSVHFQDLNSSTQNVNDEMFQDKLQDLPVDKITSMIIAKQSKIQSMSKQIQQIQVLNLQNPVQSEQRMSDLINQHKLNPNSKYQSQMCSRSGSALNNRTSPDKLDQSESSAFARQSMYPILISSMSNTKRKQSTDMHQSGIFNRSMKDHLTKPNTNSDFLVSNRNKSQLTSAVQSKEMKPSGSPSQKHDLKQESKTVIDNYLNASVSNTNQRLDSSEYANRNNHEIPLVNRNSRIVDNASSKSISSISQKEKHFFKTSRQFIMRSKNSQFNQRRQFVESHLENVKKQIQTDFLNQMGVNDAASEYVDKTENQLFAMKTEMFDAVEMNSQVTSKLESAEVNKMRIESIQQCSEISTFDNRVLNAPKPVVVTHSYDIQSLRNVLKQQLNQIKVNQIGNLKLPKTNSKRNFSFSSQANLHDHPDLKKKMQSQKVNSLLKKTNEYLSSKSNLEDAKNQQGLVKNIQKIDNNLSKLDSGSQNGLVQQKTNCMPIFERKNRSTSLYARKFSNIMKQSNHAETQQAKFSKINEKKQEDSSTDSEDELNDLILQLRSQSKSRTKDNQQLDQQNIQQILLGDFDERNKILLQTDSSDDDIFQLQELNAKDKSTVSITNQFLNNVDKTQSNKFQRRMKKKLKIQQMQEQELERLRKRRIAKNVVKVLDETVKIKKEAAAFKKKIYFEFAKAYQFDTQKALDDAEMQELQMQSSLDIMTEVLADIQIRKQDNDKNNEVKSKFVIKKMQQFARNDIFKKQLKDASEDTKRFLNDIFIDLTINNQDIVYHDPRKELFFSFLKNQTRKSKFQEQWTDDTNRMLIALRQSLLKFLEINYKMIKKIPNYKLKGMRIDKMFSQSPQAKANRRKHRQDRLALLKQERQKAILRGECVDYSTPIVMESSSDDEEDVYTGRLIQFGEGTNRIRYAIAKHLLTKTVLQLERMELKNVNQLLIFGLMGFMTALFKCMPKDQCSDLGKKYIQMGQNIFRNNALRFKIHPQVNSHLENFYRIPSANAFVEDVIRDKRDNILETHEMNLNLIFTKEVNTISLNQQLKKGYLNDSDAADFLKVAMRNYYNHIHSIDPNKIVDTELLQVKQNTLSIINKNLESYEVMALANYLMETKFLSEKKIHKLIIDSTNLTDEDLFQLMTAINQQSDDGQQLLVSMTVSNTHIGPKSFGLLIQLVPELTELTVNNIKFEPQQDCQEYLGKLMNKIVSKCKLMLKLKISKIDIRFDAFMPDMCELLRYKQFLMYLDLSWSGLLPQQLEKLSHEIEDHAYDSIRNLNLSYNCFHDVYAQNPDHHSQKKFANNICKLLHKSNKLSHLSLSGMQLNQDSLLKICDYTNNAKCLQALHLSNNGIVGDEAFMIKLLNCFNIQPEDIPLQRQSVLHVTSNKMRKHNKAFKENCERNQQIYELIKHNFSYQVPEEPEERQFRDVNDHYDRDFCKQRTLVQQHILLSKQIRLARQQRTLNDCQFHGGFGRKNNLSTPDNFVLNRILNHPELIFNQHVANDENVRNRFFVKDAMANWKLSFNEECHTCDRHPYTMIFFERGILAQNNELKEITDDKVLKMLRYEFNKDYLKSRSMTPQICGTIIQKESFYSTFQRKLKMLRVPIFSLLALSQVEGFASNVDMVNEIKEGVLKFLRNDTQEIIKQLGLDNCFQGWQSIINDMVNNNELNDVKTLNLPDLSSYNIEKLDYFVFAGFFPPGYHQFLIYDPQQERAFCKDFVIQINQRDQYPEYPEVTRVLGEIKPKFVSNMWVKWIQHTDQDLIMCYESMVEKDKFISKLCKSANDSQNTIQIIRQSMLKIVQYQLVLMSDSKLYPLISLKSIQSAILKAQESKKYKLKVKFKEEQIQRAFQLTFSDKIHEDIHKDDVTMMKQDDIEKLGLNRINMVKMLVILTKMYVSQQFNKDDRTNAYIDQVLNSFIKPLIDPEKVLKQREVIRASQKLNELYYKNVMALKELFNYLAFDPITMSSNRLSIRSVVKFFVAIQEVEQKGQPFKISKSQIRLSFSQSMMIIVSESKQKQKYDGLIFVEFLEMLARIAIHGFKVVEPIEYKTFWLLEIIWQHMSNEKLWKDESTTQLQGLNN